LHEHRRLWDSNADGIVLYQFTGYGVCYFDADGALRAAYRRPIQGYPVDEDERRRVMTEAYGADHSRPLPFLNQSAEEVFRDRWPVVGPFYTDIVTSDAGETWLLRRVSSTRVRTDVFSLERGYIGTFDSYRERLPRRLFGSHGVDISEEGTDLVIYGRSDR